MSLLRSLLLNEKINFPKGRRRTHRVFCDAPKNPSFSPLQQAEERAANIERVYSAIAAGARTRDDVIDATGLSNATVWKATLALESWPSGQRIVIERGKVPQTLRITP